MNGSPNTAQILCWHRLFRLGSIRLKTGRQIESWPQSCSRGVDCQECTGGSSLDGHVIECRLGLILGLAGRHFHISALITLRGQLNMIAMNVNCRDELQARRFRQSQKNTYFAHDP